MTRDSAAGVVLVNVLMIVALMASVVFAMVSLGDLAITRSQRFSEAAQAIALVQAGEASAMAALRRDLVEAPQSDHPGEAWGQIAQDAVAIAQGRFALAIRDAQGLVNLNGLRTTALPGAPPTDPRLLPGVIAAAGLPPDSAARFRAALQGSPQPADLADLARAATLTEAEAAALAGVATLLPGPSTVNLNAAPLAVLTVLIGNPAQARLLHGLRTRNGAVTPADLASLGILQTPSFGFASGFFEVTTEVTIGQTTQTFASLIHRSLPASGDPPDLRVVRRQRAAVPAPSLPAERSLK